MDLATGPVGAGLTPSYSNIPQCGFAFSKLVLATGLIIAFNGTLGSSLPSGAESSILRDFHLDASTSKFVLLKSLYQVSFVVSPLFFAPLIEYFGRRPLLAGSFSCYTIFTLCCALAPTSTALVIFRLLAGLSAAVSNTVVPGLFADVCKGPVARGQAVASFLFMAACGPLVEPLNLALVYFMQYLFFQSNPIVYGEGYGLSEDNIGLSYIPMLVGVAYGFLLSHYFGHLFSRAEQEGSSWAMIPGNRRLTLACIGAPCIPVALLLLGFTAAPSVHPAVPMVLSGIFFGFSYIFVFFAMILYPSDTYKRYAASAQAAASTTRLLAAVGLPFAASALYHNLGVRWAGDILAIASGMMDGLYTLHVPDFQEEVARGERVRGLSLSFR
ncbi:transmembrane transport [Ascochyta rabiei]|uniref:Transmembrane transport n=2 Tax=Didymella rabiei TaxID=5454 RepID=A0A163C2C5_DIDRA|nr:transmembrane transport [Ascochyta rabiei]